MGVKRRELLDAALRNLAVASGLQDELTARRLAKLALVYVTRAREVGHSPSFRTG